MRRTPPPRAQSPSARLCDRPVDHADAVGVGAAEKSATGQRGVPGGVAAAAQRAAETNTTKPPQSRGGEEGKVVTLRDVLGDASSAVVPGATFVDAEKVAAASLGTGRVGAGMGEVADALAAAAQERGDTAVSLRCCCIPAKTCDAAFQQRGNDLHVEKPTLPAGRRMVTASAGGQVMAQFAVPVPGRTVAGDTDAVTFAEAIDAAAHTSVGDRPVGLADAAAVQAAEMRATGLQGNVRGGVAARAQQVRETNARWDEDGGGGGEKQQVTLRDVVRGAAGAPMPADKVATREDAQMVAAAAARHVGKKGAGGGASGVIEAVAAAADMNEGRMM